MRCSHSALLALVLASTACTKSNIPGAESDRKPDGGAIDRGGKAAAQGSKLEAKLNGKPFAIDTVLASTYGGEAIRLELSPKPIECGVLKPAVVNFRNRVTVTIAPQLQSDGKRRWGVADHRAGSHGGQLADAKLTVHKSDASREVWLDIELHSEALLPFGDDPKGPPKMRPALDLTGTIRAKGCGVLPADKGQVAEEKQPDLVAELAGTRLKIRGASYVMTPHSKTLLLSTQPHPCSIGVFGADVTFRLTVEDKMVKKAWAVSVNGYLLPNQFQIPIDKFNLTRKGDAFTVDADIETSGGKLVLKGTIRPKRCKLGLNE